MYRRIVAMFFLLPAFILGCLFLVPFVFGWLFTGKDYLTRYMNRVLDIFLHILKKEW